MSSTEQYETPQDIGEQPKDLVRRWMLELKIASKTEKAWRGEAQKIIDIYQSEKAKKNSYNILWANTEILRPALYNTLPKPDIRRRFKDDDKLGRAVSDVLNRGIEFSLDCYNLDTQIRMMVLDALLGGRGVARIRYLPSFKQMDAAPQQAEDTQEAFEGDAEELDWEQVTMEHVQWDDFRRGTGKTWDEVQWIAFRHSLTRKEMVDKFGDLGKKVNLVEPKDEDVKKLGADDSLGDVFKTGEVWEVWDKETKKVIFVSDGYKNAPLKMVDDPLNLDNFFPIPAPLYAIESSSSLIPVPVYKSYQEQAEELNRISTRINKLIDILKVRGVYDATLSEMSELFRGNDGDLISIKNLSAIIDRGGLDSAIWFAPVEQLAKVLQELYAQREQCKQVIYELTGISDILRGSTNPNETASAQNIKAQWGSARLQRLQREVQRWIRDFIRMQAEIIAVKFDPETLKQMTMLQFPTQQEVDMQMSQYQQAAQMAQQQGQQPPPAPEQPITWEQIISVLRDNTQRAYKIDIETDSTIAATQKDDMDAITATMGGIVEIINGLGPAVQSGAVPIEVIKELILVVCRRAKMGNVIEDVIDKINAPAPMADPSQAQAAQAKQQADQQAQQQQQQMQIQQQQEQAKLQATQQSDQMKLQADQQKTMAQMQQEAQLEQARIQSAERIKLEEIKSNEMLEHLRIGAENDKAKLAAETSIVVAQIGAAKQTGDDSGVQQTEGAANDALTQAIAGFQAAIEQISRPKQIMRDENGRAIGIQ